MLIARTSAAPVGLEQQILISGGRLRCASPVRHRAMTASCSQQTLRLGVNRRCLAPLPNQSTLLCGQDNDDTAGHRSDSRPAAARNRMWSHMHGMSADMSRRHGRSAVSNRTPLLRFRPLQRVPTAMRCSTQPCVERSRFGVFSPACDPRVREPRLPASPLRFFALRMRCGSARCAD
jgi:hypothetical protein